MEIGEEERYAAGALLTLALHLTQVPRHLAQLGSFSSAMKFCEMWQCIVTQVALDNCRSNMELVEMQLCRQRGGMPQSHLPDAPQL